jgi:cytochrome oxidase Cu insertion factor (SCO1/SenC/PrrC family)
MRKHVCALALLAVVAVGGPFTALARADGDPGSDVLVSQDLFVTSDASASVKQQVQLGGLLQAADRAGFPVRVAIIASRYDLGAITALWLKPRTYARFLGLELSLAYKQRLVVVMPNGFGFNWPGHATASAYRLLTHIPSKLGETGLAGAAESAVRRLAGAAGIKLASPAPVTHDAAPAVPNSSENQATAAQGYDNVASIIVAALAALAGTTLAVRFAIRRRRRARPSVPSEPPDVRPQASPSWLRRAVPGFALLLGVAVGAPILALSGTPAQSEVRALATNPNLDPGTPLSGPAHDFTLSDEFGQPVSLHSFRGKVVILAFNDSECTTICPLTTTAMVDAKNLLGAAGSRVQLLGIDANPKATSIADVLSYSQLHGMLSEWRFLTGSLSQLKRVWKAYGIAAEIEHGQISHTPALFVIDPEGRLRKLYQTQQAYTAVGQLGQHRLRAARANSGRRGQRRAVPGDPASIPAQFAPPAVISGGDRSKRPGRRRLRSPRRALVRAHLARRPHPLVSRGLHLGLADPVSAVPAGTRRPGARAQGSGERCRRRAGARGLAAAAGRAARTGEPAAWLRVGAGGQGPGAPRLPDRD